MKRKTDSIQILQFGDDATIFVKIFRRISRYKLVSKYYPITTPARLARLMRVMQGQPAFRTETCKWKWTGEGWNSACEAFISESPWWLGFEYCPYCGRKIEVSE